MSAESVSSVGPADATADLRRRFGGLDRLYGAAGASRIAQAHIAIVGIGGVGSWAAEALARSGVGSLTLIDLDHIAESNINRQIHALDATLGQAKVQAMRERIAGIHPTCHVHCAEEFVEPGNWPAILQGAQVDGVIDACDQVHAKTAMAAWARSHEALFIASGAAGGKRLAHKLEVADLALVTHDPLLAQLRYRLRKHHAAPRTPNQAFGIACVFSREPVMPPDASCELDGQADGSLNCHGYGSTVAVTASFGFCAAGWMLDSLAKHPKKV